MGFGRGHLTSAAAWRTHLASFWEVPMNDFAILSSFGARAIAGTYWGLACSVYPMPAWPHIGSAERHKRR